MKSYILPIILIFAFGSLMGQSKKSEVTYSVSHTFSGEYTRHLVPLYDVFLSVDEKELDKMERFYIKLGSKIGWSDLFRGAIERSILEKKDYDKEKEKEKWLSRNGTQILVDLGRHPYTDYYLEVNFSDKDGKYKRSIKKQD